MQATTFNQTGSSVRLDNLDLGNPDANDIYMAVLFTTVPEALQAFDTASGEIYATVLASHAEKGQARSQRLIARAYQQSGEGWGIWGGAHGEAASIDGDGNAYSADRDNFGLDLGIDFRGEDNGWAAGAAVAWNRSEIDVGAIQSEAEMDSWSFGVYARVGTGHAGFSIAGGFDYTQGDTDVMRTITIGGLTRAASGEADYSSLALSGEARYGFGKRGEGWALGPLVSIHTVDADFDEVSETGAGALNLSGGEASHSTTRFGGGLFAGWQGEGGGIDGSVQYVFGDNDFAQVGLVLEGAPGFSQAVRSPVIDGDGALINVSGHTDLGENWSLSGEVRTLIGSDTNSVSGSISIGWRF